MAAANKVVIIGLDAPIVKSVERCAGEGKMPNVAKLIESGTIADNCLVPHPTITPPNWTTIVTGAWPGTHGITCFHMHKPGMELDNPSLYQAFSSQDCQAEYIWEAAERAGKKSIIINYPASWPPRIKEGVQIGGYGLHINDWRQDKSGKPLSGWGSLHIIGDEQLITNDEIPLATVIELKEAKGWKNIPNAKKSLEGEAQVGNRAALIDVKAKTYYVLVQDTEGKGYDRVSLSKSKDGNDIFFTLKKGEWSKKVSDEFDTEEGKKKAVFMGKLIELSPDAKLMSLYLTQFCHFGKFSFPEDIAGKLEGLDGLPLRPMEEGANLGWFDEQTYLERTDLENQWFGEAANYLMKNTDWTLLAMHAHVPDHTYHYLFGGSDPVTKKEDLKRCQKAEDHFYASVDKMIGRILEECDDNTLVVVVSDHGAVPTPGRTDPDFKSLDRDMFVKAGLTTLKDDPVTGRKIVDWSKTKAIPQRAVFAYVNLKGRDPHGIVEPGEEYEKVRDEIINTVYNYNDPNTGKKPFAFALKKEDARILGLYGDRVGDVVFGMHGWVSGEHGTQIPTAECGMGSIKGLLIMKGPNVKKGHRLERTAWLTDVVPTICHMLSLPVPKMAEGAILYQAMEDPDIMNKEIEDMKKKYENVKKALGN